MMSHNLSVAVNEYDVSHEFRQYLTKKFPDIVFTSPFKCDGFGESEKTKLRLLCEFKNDTDLSQKVNQVKVLSQVIYYIKNFELTGRPLPNIIFIADRDECFVMHTNDVFGYLVMDFDWSIAPSDAHKNTQLISMMMEDEKINPFVFKVDDVNACVDKIRDLNYGVKRLVPITPHNITEVFRYFEDKVIGKHNLDTNKMANLFVQLLINPEENYLHPIARRKTIVTKAFNEVNVKSREAFTSFFSHFSNEYTPKQREHLTAVVDRIVEDVTRRKQGEFFTPAIWVDKAHEYISSVFGENWKEEYVVWDPAWGTGNLTRDYKFKELYVSTLIYSDIETANQMGYNPEAVKFQFDFLNDDYGHLPAGLRKAIESGKKIIILMNPPYGTANDGSAKGATKIGVSDTEIGKLMRNQNMGKSSQQLYNQFIFRIITEISADICMFTPPLYISGPSSEKLRTCIFSKYNFEKGFLMDSSNFADVKSWGLSFSILKKGETRINNFVFDVLEINKDFEIKKTQTKTIFNTDKKTSLSEWVKEPIKKMKVFDVPQMTSPFNVAGKGRGNVVHGYLGYIMNNSNNINESSTGVGICSSTFAKANGLSIHPNNFYRCMVTLSSRKLISSNWINSKDEYLMPNEEHEDYKNYINDSIIFSLFNSASNQSSLRQVTYKNKLWDIKNEFFWMSKQEIMDLADKNKYNELYSDARTDTDRYVYKLLFGEQRIYDQLSPEAKDVLDSATNLVRLSFNMRRNFADDTNHLNSWDAGYAQLKLLWKEYFPVQFKEFRDKYKVLEDKMRPMVYELGFLMK